MEKWIILDVSDETARLYETEVDPIWLLRDESSEGATDFVHPTAPRPFVFIM